ncbi:MAG TPA: helix-turn-helix domain-containing protein [Candidatus Dormibacteraeota bacterium]|nr:helix-turn-helix domain-containing protein [Candidatus Dormibacteraeota bacterium]
MASRSASRGDPRLFAEACLWVQEAETPQEVLQRANEAARLLLGTSCSYLAVRDGDVLRLAAHSGFRKPETASRWLLPVGQGIGGRVVERGETLVVRDYRHDPRRERFSKSVIDAEGLRCSIAAPIRSGGRVVGVLYAAEHRLRRFSAAEVELHTLFARFVSTALTAVEARQALRQRLAACEEAERQRAELRRLVAEVAAALVREGGLEAALGVIAGRLTAAVLVHDRAGNPIAQVGESGGAETQLPLGVVGRWLGRLVVVRDPAPSQDERICLEQVAHLVTIWLLRSQGFLSREQDPTSRFLDDLLHGRLGDEETVVRQAAMLGIDLGVARAVLRVGLCSAGWTSSEPPFVTREAAEALRRVADRRGLEPIVDLCGHDAVLLVRAVDVAGLRPVVSALLRDTSALLGGARLAAGLGRTCHRLGDYAESHREATVALEVARALPEGGVRTHEELGFYGLMAQAVDPGVLDALAERALGPLLEADARRRTRYVPTLAAYLDADRRLKPAAAALHVHVNTLRYRLARIERLLGIDLEDVEARFLLELAVRLLGARGRIPRPGGRREPLGLGSEGRGPAPPRRSTPVGPGSAR